MKDKWYQLIYWGTIGTELRLRRYFKLLKSDQYFSEDDYKWFGKRIYDLRLYRKMCADELVKRIFRKSLAQK